MLTYPTLSDALAAGYRRCSARRFGDMDTSTTDYDSPGSTSVGYTFSAPDGRDSVTVHLTETRNARGGQGAFIELMPLAPGVDEVDEAAAWERHLDETDSIRRRQKEYVTHLDIEAVAHIAGVHPSTWRAYVARGQAPAPDGRTGASPWWFRGTIEQWLSQRPGAGARTDLRG